MGLLNPKAKYQLLANNIPRVDYATGGLLQNSPIVCGGTDEKLKTSKNCVVIGQPEMKMEMIGTKERAASVALDPSTLWIVGGKDGRCDLFSNFSTELIKLGQPSVKGPDLPFTISSHTVIQYDKKSIYIIGGIQNGCYSNKTWIVDPTNGFLIKEGPSMNKARSNHGCAKMTVNRKTILVVVGGTNLGHLGSVEILDPSENNIWIPGLYLKSTLIEV